MWSCRCEISCHVYLQVEEPPMGQLQAQLLWKLRQYLDQLLQAGSFSTVMASVLQDLKPGLHISRLTREDFLCFFRLANLGTAYVRTQQVRSLSLLLFAVWLHHNSRAVQCNLQCMGLHKFTTSLECCCVSDRQGFPLAFVSEGRAQHTALQPHGTARVHPSYSSCHLIRMSMCLTCTLQAAQL